LKSPINPRRPAKLNAFYNRKRFSLTVAAPTLGTPAVTLVRRAAKRKTLSIITR
jgi:hypothetical protein